VPHAAPGAQQRRRDPLALGLRQARAQPRDRLGKAAVEDRLRVAHGVRLEAFGGNGWRRVRPIRLGDVDVDDARRAVVEHEQPRDRADRLPCRVVRRGMRARVHQQHAVALERHRDMPVAEKEDVGAGRARPRGESCQLRLHRVVDTLRQLDRAIEVMAVRQQEAPPAKAQDLLERQLALALGGVVVAVHRHDRCDRAQLVEHAQLADVAGVHHQVDPAERGEDARLEPVEPLRHVRV
jgi:hypothetical protein